MADQCSDSPHRVQEAAGGCMPLRRLAGSSLWQLTCYNPRWDDSNYHRWTSWFKDLGCCDEQLGQQFIVMKQAFGILSPWRYKTKGIAAVTLKVILWGALTIFRSEGGHVCGVSSQFPRGGLVMTGIQLNDCDLILQGPVCWSGQDDRCGWVGWWMDRWIERIKEEGRVPARRDG